jgi:hypothetical protein
MSGAARATQSRPAPVATERASESSGSSQTARLQDARVSSILSGKNLYRMSDGRIIELPDDITAEQAAKLEADAKVAQQKLGKGPAPKPVPQVKKAADKSGKKDAKKPPPKSAKGGAGRKGGPKSTGRMAALKSFGGKVAKFLLGKAGPVLQRGISKLRTLSKNEQTHDDAATKVKLAEKAVVHPPSEGQSKSNNAQVQAVEARPAPPVDPEKGKATLQKSLTDNVPKSIEDVDNFKRDMKGQHIGADVMKTVQGDKNAVVGTFADMEKTQPPAPPEQVPENLPPPEAAPPTGAMNLGAGAVAPLQPEHTDVSKFTKEGDAKLKEEGVTQEQLDMVDSGDLAAANKEKKGMEQMAKTEPLAIKQQAQKETAKVDADLKNEEKKERGALNAKRKGGLTGANQKQKKAKSDLEKKREEVAAKINGIHKAAQDKVKKKLADLETQSMKRFDDGNTVATKAFESDVNREIEAFKDDRYSGVFGWARKAKDWLLGMDELPGVKAIFERNRAKFVATIEKLVADIGAENKRVIQECKDDLAKARAEIKEYVDKLGPSLKDIGQKTAGEVNRQLDDMDKFVAKKEEELQQKLADKQQAAIKAIDEKIEKMKDAMGGALAKLGKLLLLAAKKFFTWALEKFGYSLGEIQSIIDKGAAVLKAIFTKPIQFVKNLMKAAITGFENFGKKFLTYLKESLFEWLTGAMEGVKFPTSWDFMGIVGFLLQLVGITYVNVRKHMVTELGEPAVVALEGGFKLVKTLITEGPMAAWEQLKEMAGEMRDTFIDAVKDFIKTKIIEQAIIWIGSLLIPGAGIVKAIIGIYDTIVFFIQKAKQIMKMIANFLGSISEIAAGNIGAAAAAMEAGLARGLTLVISFLAKLLKMDGITAKIKNAISKVRGKVDGVLAKIAKWIGTKAKALIGGIKKGAKSLLAWWKKKKAIKAGGESHTLTFVGEKQNARLVVRSDPVDPPTFVLRFVPDGKVPKKVTTLNSDIADLTKQVNTAQAASPPNEAKIATLDQKLTAKFNELGELLATLTDSSAAMGSEKNPVPIEYPKRRAAAYPNIYTGPESDYYIKQDWLKACAAMGSGKKARDSLLTYEPKLGNEEGFKKWKGAVSVFKASGGPAQALPNSSTVGLSDEFASLAPGKLLVFSEKGKTGGGGKINKLFKPFGFRPKHEDLDGDHVMERQLGGPDEIKNLWPLKAGENRSSGSLLNTMEVPGTKMTLNQAREKRPKQDKKKTLYLLIKKTKVV